MARILGATELLALQPQPPTQPATQPHAALLQLSNNQYIPLSTVPTEPLFNIGDVVTITDALPIHKHRPQASEPNTIVEREWNPRNAFPAWFYLLTPVGVLVSENVLSERTT